MTNSRVSGTRPLRPANGWRARISTESQIWFVILLAAASSSAAMYSSAAANCCVAGVLHQMSMCSALLRAAHLVDHLLHVRVRDELSFLCRAQALLDQLDMMFVEPQIIFHRLVQHVAAVAVQGLGKLIQRFHGIGRNAETDGFQRAHRRSPISRIIRDNTSYYRALQRSRITGTRASPGAPFPMPPSLSEL